MVHFAPEGTRKTQQWLYTVLSQSVCVCECGHTDTLQGRIGWELTSTLHILSSLDICVCAMRIHMQDVTQSCAGKTNALVRSARICLWQRQNPHWISIVTEKSAQECPRIDTPRTMRSESKINRNDSRYPSAPCLAWFMIAWNICGGALSLGRARLLVGTCQWQCDNALCCQATGWMSVSLWIDAHTNVSQIIYGSLNKCTLHCWTQFTVNINQVSSHLINFNKLPCSGLFAYPNSNIPHPNICVAGCGGYNRENPFKTNIQVLGYGTVMGKMPAYSNGIHRTTHKCWDLQWKTSLESKIWSCKHLYHSG